MRATVAPAKWFGPVQWQTAVLIFTSIAMAAALMARFGLHIPPRIEPLLLVGILGSCMPILVELIGEMARGNFSVDLLAAISILTSLILHEYWVAAIVILMLSGGQTLETFATRRASSVLGALAKRMPEIAHRVEADRGCGCAQRRDCGGRPGDAVSARTVPGGWNCDGRPGQHG